MKNNQEFLKAVKEADIPTKDKFSVVHDFLAVTQDQRKSELEAYRDELLRQINRDIMSEKHPAFAAHFKAL